ncbi:MAG: transcriptional activator NhaR [Thermoanaerobaculia bacterium]|nr:transcriptional activator NhaR [Thermoanaerobaculia bacterium]
MYSGGVERLNYHHLQVFWTAAREGGVTRASEKLHVSQPTVTTQIRALERTLGTKLFRRSGRRLVLTDSGRSVYRYADEIVGLGRDLMDTMKDGAPRREVRLTVGVADVLSKLIANRILEPALRLPEPVRLEAIEDTPERLLAELALFALDVVLADAPVGPSTRVRAYNHLLGECAVSVFGADRLARAYRRGFPRSLDGAPFLLPRRHSALRVALDDWFEREGVRPHVVGEFDDSALMKAVGQAGIGLFPAPSPIAGEVCRQHDVRSIGTIESVRQRFFAITVERKVKHPAVIAICEAARRRLFP